MYLARARTPISWRLLDAGRSADADSPAVAGKPLPSDPQDPHHIDDRLAFRSAITEYMTMPDARPHAQVPAALDDTKHASVCKSLSPPGAKIKFLHRMC